jgi:hypothetical protein
MYEDGCDNYFALFDNRGIRLNQRDGSNEQMHCKKHRKGELNVYKNCDTCGKQYFATRACPIDCRACSFIKAKANIDDKPVFDNGSKITGLPAYNRAKYFKEKEKKDKRGRTIKEVDIKTDEIVSVDTKVGNIAINADCAKCGKELGGFTKLDKEKNLVHAWHLPKLNVKDKLKRVYNRVKTPVRKSLRPLGIAALLLGALWFVLNIPEVLYAMWNGVLAIRQQILTESVWLLRVWLFTSVLLGIGTAEWYRQEYAKGNYKRQAWIWDFLLGFVGGLFVVPTLYGFLYGGYRAFWVRDI